MRNYDLGCLFLSYFVYYCVILDQESRDPDIDDPATKHKKENQTNI
jgi:hypothetical protein